MNLFRRKASSAKPISGFYVFSASAWEKDNLIKNGLFLFIVSVSAVVLAVVVYFILYQIKKIKTKKRNDNRNDNI